jgi:alkylated DNA repair dioxygenase AlkB
LTVGAAKLAFFRDFRQTSAGCGVTSCSRPRSGKRRHVEIEECAVTDLFNEKRFLDLPRARVSYDPVPDLGIGPDILFDRLLAGIAWEQHAVRIQDRVIPQPRLSCWFGDTAHRYSTLAHSLTPHPFGPLLEKLRARVESITGARFNSMLANLYRDGTDAIGWHADDEPELGLEPVIASISLGAVRRFDMRQRSDHSQTTRILLEHGSLLVMSGGTQRFWQHSIARTRGRVGERINLTFRLTRPFA